MSSGSTCTMRVSETHDSLSHGLDLVPLRPFSPPLQLRPRRHNLAPVNAKIEDTQGEAARAPPVPSPPVPPPGLSVPPRPLSSYDDMDGYEAGVRGAMDAAEHLQPWCRPCPALGACAGAMPPHGEASGEGAAAAVAEERRRQGASCLLVEDQANRGEVAMEALSACPLSCLALQKLAKWLEARAFSRCPNRAACSRVRGPAAGHGGVAAERSSHVSDAWHMHIVGRAWKG